MYENFVQNNPPVIQPKPRNARFELTKKDIAFAIIFAFLSILISSIGIFDGFKAGFSTATILILIAVTIYFKNKEVKLKIYPCICFLLILGLALNFSFTSNASVKFWSFAILNLLLLTWFTSLVAKEKATGDLGIIKEIFSPIFRLAFPNLPNTVVSLFKGRKNKTFLKILFGVLPAIPVLLVVIPLLMSSDAAFSGMISLVFENIILSIFKINFGIIIAAFLITYCFSLRKKELPEIKQSNFKGLEATPVISFLSVLSVCYLSYLFSQLAYFFSAFRGFLPKDYDFSLASYARRGFFEMTIIAAINFTIIFTALLISRKKNEKIHIISRLLCTFIGIFTLVIITTAISKMFLYIKNFGMTELRITTSMFMVFLAVVFITLMLRLFIPAVKVIKTGFIAASIILILLGAFNVNHVVAKYNYTAYKNETLKSIDVETIYQLGDEGIPYLAKLINDKNEDVAKEAKLKLSYALDNYYETDYNTKLDKLEIIKRSHDGIGDFNIPQKNAYEILDDLLKKDPELLNYKTDISDSEYL